MAMGCSTWSWPTMATDNSPCCWDNADGLALANVVCLAGLLNPTALALASFDGGVVELYVIAEGAEAAARLRIAFTSTQVAPVEALSPAQETPPPAEEEESPATTNGWAVAACVSASLVYCERDPWARRVSYGRRRGLPRSMSAMSG